MRCSSRQSLIEHDCDRTVTPPSFSFVVQIDSDLPGGQALLTVYLWLPMSRLAFARIAFASRLAKTIHRALVQDAPTGLVEPKLDEAVDASPTAQKRKAASPGPKSHDGGSKSPKRMRRDSESTRDGSIRSPPASASVDRRQSASVEEKKRGKRLFGGLLSTLSQTNNSSQRRKQDGERRQQARASQQKAEGDKHREARLSKLKSLRKLEQIDWEERVVCGFVQYMQWTQADHLYRCERNMTTYLTLRGFSRHVLSPG